MNKPGKGFICLLIAYLLLAGFLVWGFKQPALEQAWELENQREGEAWIKP